MVSLRDLLLDTLRPEPEGRWVACHASDGAKCTCDDVSNGHGCSYAHADSFNCKECTGSGRVPVLTRLGLVERCPTYTYIQKRSWVDDGMHYWLGRKHHDAATCSGWVLAPSVAALSDELLMLLVHGAIDAASGESVDDFIAEWVTGWLEANQS